MRSGLPKVQIVDETMREGMQIESAGISVEDKVRLLQAIIDTGLSDLVVGSFVSPKYTPQMAKIDEVLSRVTWKPGVVYRAFTLNPKGVERMSEYGDRFTPWGMPLPRLSLHMSDTFIRRNSNISNQQEIDRWPLIVEAAVAAGAKEAAIGMNAAWGSNFDGRYTNDDRMVLLRTQHAMWSEAGIRVTGIFFGDPMSWCMPNEVESQLRLVRETWPDIHEFHLHLHNARGMAMTCAYEAIRVLGPNDTVRFETTLGGIGGCPYCGNGQATGMVPTEDLVAMLEEMGVDTGVDIDHLVRAVWLLEEILGRPTMGHVSKAGPRPHGDDVYDPNIPFIETMAQARHFLLGPSVYKDALSPWDSPIPAPHPRQKGEPHA